MDVAVERVLGELGDVGFGATNDFHQRARDTSLTKGPSSLASSEVISAKVATCRLSTSTVHPSSDVP